MSLVGTYGMDFLFDFQTVRQYVLDSYTLKSVLVDLVLVVVVLKLNQLIVLNCFLVKRKERLIRHGQKSCNSCYFIPRIRAFH